jgi:hypothetical protein
MKIFGVISLICCAIILPITAHAQEWQGLRPLRSTRADVEKLLGKPQQRSPAFYRLKDKSILIGYNNISGCDDKDSSNWNVPKDTVITIAVTFFPQHWVKLSELKLDLSKFEKFSDEEFPGLFYYVSNEAGLNIATDDAVVSSIAYFPAKKDWHLMCREAAPNKRINRTRN